MLYGDGGLQQGSLYASVRYNEVPLYNGTYEYDVRPLRETQNNKVE